MAIMQLLVLITCLAVKSSVELVDRRRDFQAGLKNSLLPLEPDVLGPPDETAEIALGLDVLADLKVAGTRLEQGVLHPLDLGLLHSQGSGRDLLSLLLALEMTIIFST